MKRFLLIALGSLVVLTSVAQDVSQVVKGNVVDDVSEKPLASASVRLFNERFKQETTTDTEGNFEFTAIPPDRYQFQVSFTGYFAYVDEVLVISGKENTIRIRLKESSTVLREVTVGAGSLSRYTPGVENISIEKTMRIPANFFDPVRMITSYPAVVAANDQGNAIIVKGNSPNGLLWRLNGVDIVNPNHLANAGTFSDKPMANGGGVNILSAQMLDHTNFYSGAFPASYGNALSGVLDMNLRNGNADKIEYTAQASLIGLDVAAEGPLTKKHNSSFLANYRYSTVGLLSQLGVNFGDEAINFQDFSFNLNFDQKNGGSFGVFAFYGNSKNEFDHKEADEWEEDKDKYDINYKANTYGLGVNYTTPAGPGNLLVALAYSSSDQSRDANVTDEIPLDEYLLREDAYASTRSILSGNIRFATKTGSKGMFEVGMMTNLQTEDLAAEKTFGALVGPPPMMTTIEGKSDGVLLQPYTSWRTSLAEKLGVTLGARYLHYTYTGSGSFEPRVSLDVTPTASSSVVASYGLVSQQQLAPTYFTAGNEKLGFTKAHHVEVGYRLQVNESMRLKSEIFYQNLFDVPIEDDITSTFSVLNLLETAVPANLVNNGTGENYGITATVEKSFFGQHYFIAGASYYQSKYAGGDEVSRNTRFNGNYTVNAVYGKEWTKSSKNRTIGLNTRLLYLGGLRESAVDVDASNAAYETVYDTSNPYSEKLGDYFRLDLRLSFRKNKPGYTRIFAIDIQNVLGMENEGYHYYDFTQQKVVAKNQLGLIPVLVYRIDF